MQVRVARHTDPLEIRTGRPDDAEALRELHRAASYVWEEDREHLDAHPEVFGVDPAALAAGEVRVAVGSGGAPIGFATVRPGPDRECVLEDLFVEPALMRTGVGRALVEDAAARAAAGGHLVMSVVGASRTQGFYERLGFVVRGDATTQFGPALRLSRKLGFEVHEHTGTRSELRGLFELAEDSPAQLDSYIDEGRVLVAAEGDRILGHLQITETADPEQVEIKNMAVDGSRQRRGIGRALVETAISLARDEGRSTIVVATAAADTRSLRFYQRLGFRMLSVERDAFTADTGYPAGLEIDGVGLRDRVWLDLALSDARG